MKHTTKRVSPLRISVRNPTQTKAISRTRLKRPSIVIVSNRLPISVKKVDGKLEYFPSIGGLATGLASYTRDKRNKWIGWPGVPSDQLSEQEKKDITRELLKHNCYPVFLSQKQLDDFYNGYSNTILWPLFHDLPAKFEGHDEYFEAYKEVNKLFSEAVLSLSDKTSSIWVHDYQLLLLPGHLRNARPKAKIGFFLHIPFPMPENFVKLPAARKLVAGLLGSDLVGMHTRTYADNFLRATNELVEDTVGPGQVILADRVVQVTDFPMGIDYNRFTRARDLLSVKKEVKKHQRKYKGMKVIVTVDRLDPTKGIAERLEAYHEFLRQSPSLHGKVVMAMLAVPSRTEIEEYQNLKERVEGLVKKINSEFGTRKWQPIDYMSQAIPVESVTALYQVADVAFITPIRDGMNLVAKEFIASKPKNDGVLILSETAGAAQELTDALMVNPKRRSTMVSALKSAVKMQPRELKRRLRSMHDQIATHTVQYWAKDFMSTLQRPVTGSNLTRTITKDYVDEISESYKNANRRLVLLDYDGVLAPFADKPEKAAPTKTVLNLLGSIAESEETELAVISGRGKQNLQEWFGELGVTLVAEHGAFVKHTGQKNWKSTISGSSDWKNIVELFMEKYAAKTPGAFVEMKEHAAVWHYRNASSYYAQKNLVTLKRVLNRVARDHGLEVRSGNKILEVKPRGVNKGVAALGLMQEAPDFILCIGDDYTDEDMFKALPTTSYTIKVGRGSTDARFRVHSVDEVVALLKQLTK